MFKTMRTLSTVLVLLLLFGAGLAVGIALMQGGLAGLLGVSSQPTISAVTVLDRIQSLAELTTTRYNFSSIVTSERQMPPLLQALYGDRQVLIAVGYIDAGVDLNQLDADAIRIDDTTLTITLPAPSLRACVLNEQETHVVDRDTGLFAPDTPNLDTQARRYAVAQFRDQALEEGILQEAQDKAQTIITQFLLASNPEVQLVNVNFATVAPNPALPDTCLGQGT